MQRLSNLLDAGHVALDVEAPDVPSLLQKMAQLLVVHDHLSATCGDTLSKALLRRELLSGTCVGHGVAVPHAYVVEIPAPIMLLARLKEPIAYGNPRDGRPVDLVFLLTGPKTQRTDVQLLARIVRLLHDDAWLEALRAARSPEDVMVAVADVEGRHA